MEIPKRLNKRSAPYYLRRLCGDKLCASRRKRQLDLASGRIRYGAPRTIYCKLCNAAFQSKKGKPTDFCEGCRKNPAHRREKDIYREYQWLLKNSEKLKMRGFIKLLALAEYLGRDLDEWLNESRNLRELSQRLSRERALFEEGERRKKNPERVQHDSEILMLSDYCSCPACARIREQLREQRRI